VLDTNENDLKLLKMKEKLLEVTDANHEENLRIYAQLAVQIDKDYYNGILNKINESNYHNQTLEEELVFLEELEKEYEQLFELQCRFKEIYERYSSSKLVLSDIDTIDIDAIKNRMSVISGYLINLKNMEDNKKELEKCNEQLILEEKKKKEIEKRLGALEDELKKSFLNAEGRVYSKETNSIGYTSVVNEYKSIDIDIVTLLNDEERLTQMLKEAINNRNEKEEVLSTAMICYDNIPNKENKEILDSINVETVRVRYRLAMFKILDLISKKWYSYEQVKTKREELIDLIKYRKACLEQLGTKFSIDPFSRIKIEEQVKFILELGSNSKMISKIRKHMTDISDMLDEMTAMNDDFLDVIGDKVELIKDNLSMSSIDISSVDDMSLEIEEEAVDVKSVEYADNQVISIGDISSRFNLKRANEKSDGVIKRVMEMINGNYVTESSSEEIVPELVVEKVSTVEDDKESELSYDEQVVDSEYKNDMFEKTIVSEPLFVDDVKLDTKEIAFENDATITPYHDGVDDEIINTNGSGLLNSIDGEESNSKDIDIFQDVTPFEETKLFDDKFDDEVVDEGFSFSDEMPEAFWVTQEGDTEKDEDVISFDEQINRLLSNNDNDSKVKKLVA